MSEIVKPSILITIDWFLPGTKSGGPVRSYANLIDHLGSYFDFYVVTRNTDYCETEPYEGIKSDTWTQFNSNTKVYYISQTELSYKGLSKILTSRHFDVVYINGIYSWYFSIVPLLIFKDKHENILVSARGMLNTQAFSVKPLKKRVFLKLAELFNLYNKVTFHATNNLEREQILSVLSSNTKIRIAPNLPRKSDSSFIEKDFTRPIRMVNLGRISKEKGTLLMLKVLKDFKHQLELDIYGSIYDINYWQECEQIIKGLPTNVQVTYCGVAKSEEISEVLSKYHFFIMLSEGENFGHAILEALSCGLPVIISNNTPWRDLEKKGIGWDIDLSDALTITSTLESLFSINQEEYNHKAQEAFKFANTFINDPELIEQNKKLFLPKS